MAEPQSNQGQQTPSPLLSQWVFQSDSPILNSKGDDLGRTFFAEHLASVIKDTAVFIPDKSGKPDEGQAEQDFSRLTSITIGIFGPWGSGKTSLKNLICEALEKSGDDKPHVAHFNPRQWRDEPLVIKAFFDEIGRVVKEDNSPESGETAELLQRLSTYLQAPAVVTTGVLLAAALGAHIPLTPEMIAAISAGTGSFNAGSSFWGNISKHKKEKKEKAAKAQEDIKQVRDRLVTKIASLEKPVVMFIDDIDRLTADETALLFQLLKYNADFPNLIYVVIGQRDIVEQGLNKLFPDHGERYLEKFIQLVVDLPQVEAATLRESLLSSMVKALEIAEQNSLFARRRLKQIYSLGIEPYFSGLRRVHRYTNSVRFLIPLWSNVGFDEVDMADVILLEVLRLYEPRVYDSVREEKAWLTDYFSSFNVDKWMEEKYGHNRYNNEEERRRHREELEKKYRPHELDSLAKILDKAYHPKAAKFLLWALFPNLGELFRLYEKETGRDLDDYETISVHYNEQNIYPRLNDEKYFDRYLLLKVESSRLTREEKIKLYSALGNRDALLAVLKEIDEAGHLSDVWVELDSFVKSIKVEQVVGTVAALINCEHTFLHNEWTFASIPPSVANVCVLIHKALSKCANIDDAVSAFEQALSVSNGILIPIVSTIRVARISLLELVVYFREVHDWDQDRRTNLENRILALSEEGWNRLIAASQWDEEFSPLATHPFLGWLLTIWAAKNANDCQQWVKQLISHPTGVATFARAIAEIDERDRDYNEGYPATFQKFSLLKMEDLVSLEELWEATKVDFTGLQLLNRAWADSIKDGLNRHFNEHKEPYYLIGQWMASVNNPKKNFFGANLIDAM